MCFGCVGTSGVAERFEVESQLLHTLSGLLIMLGVFRTGNQGNWLSLRDLHQNTEGTFGLNSFDTAAPRNICFCVCAVNISEEGRDDKNPNDDFSYSLFVSCLFNFVFSVGSVGG